MAKNVTIITEGKFDAEALTEILKDKNLGAEYKIISAGGYSSALSKARSLLSFGDQKVLLLLDTDSVEKDKIDEKKEFVDFYVSGKNNSEYFKAVWAIPEFEIIFLKNKKFLHQLRAEELSHELLEIGEASPRRMLESISHEKRDSFLPLLNNKEVRDEFFKEGPVKEICDFMIS